MPYVRVVGRNSCLFEDVFVLHIFRLRCCMNNSGKFFCNSSFTGEVSSPVNLERWKDTDVSLLITTYADNKYDKVFVSRTRDEERLVRENGKTVY